MERGKGLAVYDSLHGQVLVFMVAVRQKGSTIIQPIRDLTPSGPPILAKVSAGTR